MCFSARSWFAEPSPPPIGYRHAVRPRPRRTANQHTGERRSPRTECRAGYRRRTRCGENGPAGSRYPARGRHVAGSALRRSRRRFGTPVFRTARTIGTPLPGPESPGGTPADAGRCLAHRTRAHRRGAADGSIPGWFGDAVVSGRAGRSRAGIVPDRRCPMARQRLGGSAALHRAQARCRRRRAAVRQPLGRQPARHTKDSSPPHWTPPRPVDC